MASSTQKAREAQFRDDIAAQLRGLGVGDVTVSPDRIVLEWESPSEGPLRVVAGLKEDDVGQPGWADWLQLRVESEDRITPLLTLAWRDGGLGLLEQRVDPDLPLDRRGLNAAADIREGRYGRGDVLHRLRADLDAVRGHGARRPSPALTRADRPGRAVAVVQPVSDRTADTPVDAEFEIVAPSVAGRNIAPVPTRTPSLEELKERLIAELFEALQRELLSREAALRGARASWSIKVNVLKAQEWAMLGVAYAVDAVTSRTAIGTFLPGNAGWLYGLVGPVLIGGLGSLARGRIERGAAVALTAGWASFVGLVTASDDTYLSGAQAWFPKGDTVRAHEEALSLARLEQTAADREVTRLEANSGANVAAAVAGAKRRWQADEARKAAEAEKRDIRQALEDAKTRLKDAGGRVVREEAALRQAMLTDGSRLEAWRALFAIFTLINFVGPYAISRVLGKWRSDHAAAQADAEAGHHARASANLLRDSRGAQKARAMGFFAAAVEALSKAGIPAELLSRIDGAEIAASVAERFDRSVNPGKYRPRARFFGWNRN
jgi:hypothetical protein